MKTHFFEPRGYEIVGDENIVGEGDPGVNIFDQKIQDEYFEWLGRIKELCAKFKTIENTHSPFRPRCYDYWAVIHINHKLYSPSPESPSSESPSPLSEPGKDRTLPILLPFRSAGKKIKMLQTLRTSQAIRLPPWIIAM